MLDFLRFSTDSEDRSLRLLAEVRNGLVSVTTESQDFPLYSGVRILPREEGDRWLSAIGTVQVNLWKSRYAFNGLVYDGEKWSLTYHMPGKRRRRISGYADYPDKWQTFLEVLNQIAPVISPWPVDWLSLRYLWRESPSTEFEYREFLIIDRDSETVAIAQTASTGVEITKQYRVEGGVSALRA